ncbi:MAG: NTP transferase domain-containing protein, partial [Gammaproteobacteria bacterium]|nr:NTP transferase domain-containing protein [Gammaproteobacteria bacterium]
MTGSQQNAVAGAVLCGGKSSRLGGDKARAELGGKPLLDHVIERLQPQVEDVVLSVEQD